MILTHLPTTMQRDPHLPPPAVVDWLLEREWSDERVVEQRVKNMAGRLLESGTLISSSLALVAIGADETAHFQLPIEALELLRADQAERRIVEEEQSNDNHLTNEEKLAVNINRVCELAEGVSAIACIGALTACAISITSQVYDLKMQSDETNA